MNYYVPDFEMDDDAALPTPSSTLTRPKKSSSSTPEEEIMELLWQNGQVVMQSQTQRSVKKSPPPPSRYEDAVLPADQSTAAPTEIQSSHHQQQSNHLFMQEDEMASWLHYPLQEANFDHDFCADLLYPPSAPCVTSATTVNTGGPARSTIQHPDLLRPPVAAARPPIPPARRPEAAVQNFPYFSRHNRGRIIGAGGGFGVSETGPSSLRSVVRESTVVDSCVTPTTIGSDARISEVAGRSAAGGASSGGDNTYGTMSGAVLAPTFSGATVGAGTEMMTTTCEMTVTSSTGGSSGSAEPQTQKPPVDYRKRKGREEDAECHSEDAEFESADTKKQGRGPRGSSSIKRSRAAEVHNLSERRRRDRINEKMKALQELIPRCNKSDKASMLDEAIEYLKSLQLQVQMMSMGCSMVPMMFPGIQQYMPPMGMGMGMGMGMEMGMNRPMMPFHNMLPGAPSPNPAAAAQLGPRFPMPAFHMPPVPPSDPTRIQAVNQSDPMLGSIGVQNGNQPRVPNFSDPYQRYLGLHQMQLPIPQNQTMPQPSTSKPSTSRGAEDRGNHPSGR